MAFCVVAWLQSSRKDASKIAFDQVQLGMTVREVDAVMHLNVRSYRERLAFKEAPYHGDVSPEYAFLVARWFGYRIIPDRYLVTYWFEFEKVVVVFGSSDQRVVDKSLVQYLRPTFLDRVRLA